MLSKSAFAAWLLGYDSARTECSEIIRTHTDFADGDDNKDSAARIDHDGQTLFDLRFDVPPQEAVDYFRRKKILPPAEFYKLEGEAKAGAFSVGRVNRLDVITGFRDEIADAMAEGRTPKQTIDRLRSILNGAGHAKLSTEHLETIVRTTMQISYGVGRRIGQESVSDLLPVWEYSAVGDDRTRPSHRALDGLQYPANHRFWDKYYGPWDYRCRCTVIPVLDIRKGYDRSRPNDESVVTFDADGMPASYNVSGTSGDIKATDFVGVPRQASLENVLRESAERALDSRQRKR